MEKEYFFDRPKNKKRFFLVLYAAFSLSIVAEFFVHKHAYFSWEKYPLFYAAFGFVAFVALILAGKHILRPIVKRKEDYYD